MADQVVRLEDSWPFDSYESKAYDRYGHALMDRAVRASAVRHAFRQFFTTGIVPGVDSLKLSVADGYALNIAKGLAIIDGGFGGVEEDDGLALALTDAPPRGDVTYAVFVMLDDNDDARSLYIRTEETPGDVPADPVREGAIYELRLGYITLPSGAQSAAEGVLVDERGTSICPYASPLMEVDVAGILDTVRDQAGAQYEAFVAYLQQGMDFVAAAIDGTTAGHLSNRIDDAVSKLQQLIDEAARTLGTDEGLMDLRGRMGLGYTLEPSANLYDQRMIRWLQLKTPIPKASVSYTNITTAIGSYVKNAAGSPWDVMDAPVYDPATAGVKIRSYDSENVLTETQAALPNELGYSFVQTTKVTDDQQDRRWIMAGRHNTQSSSKGTQNAAWMIDFSDSVLSVELLGEALAANITYATPYEPSYAHLCGEGLYYMATASGSSSYYIYGLHMADGVVSFGPKTTTSSLYTGRGCVAASDEDGTITYTLPTSNNAYYELQKDSLEVAVHQSAPPEDLSYQHAYFFFSPDAPEMRTATVWTQTEPLIDGVNTYAATKRTYTALGDVAAEETEAFRMAHQLGPAVTSFSVLNHQNMWYDGVDGQGGRWLLCQGYLTYIRDGTALVFNIDTVHDYYMLDIASRPYCIPTCDAIERDDGTVEMYALLGTTSSGSYGYLMRATIDGMEI